MNLALLTDQLTGGGAEYVVSELATRLGARGHRVGVYCLQNPPASAPLRSLDRATVRFPGDDRQPTGSTRLLLRWLRRDRIQIAHAHNSAALLVALPAARLLGIPVVHTRHGGLLGRPSRYRRLADLLAPLVDRTTIVAEALRAKLPHRRWARAAVHIPNGLDRPALAPPEARRALEALCQRPLSGPVVLSVGTICAEKDTGGLLAAFARLRTRVPAATLVCIGRERGSDYAAQVQQARARLDLGDSVIFTGPCNDAWRLMAGADAFCLSSRTEAMPNVIVEAMSQHVPIVATAVGDVACLNDPADDRPTLVHHRRTALIVPPGNPTALADALAESLGDRAAAQARAARAAADYARNYTTDRMTTRYEQLYAACLRRLPLPPRAGAGGGFFPQSSIRNPRPAPPRILMLGPDPVQIGGMNAVIEALCASPLANRCRLLRHGLPAAAPAGHTPRGPRVVAGLRRQLNALARHTRALLDLAHTIRRQHIDIVHIHTCSFFSFYRSLLDLAVARLLHRRAGLHIHGGRFHEFCANAGPFGRWLIRRGCEAADAVIVLSRQALHRLRPYAGHARIEIIPNGVPVRPATTGAAPPDRPCRFVFLGGLTRAKGLPELLEAATQLRKDNVLFELLIAGPSVASEPDNWAALIAARSLQDHAHLLGPVHGRAKDELLTAADCLVLPSHAEGLPMVVLEAAAAGLAVIATEVGGLPELLAPTADLPACAQSRYIAPLVPIGCAPQLAAEMSRLARDPNLRHTIARAVHNRVAAEHDLARIADRVADLYAQLGARPPGPQRRAAAAAWLARNITYPLHEHLRGRPTLALYGDLRRRATLAPSELHELTARRQRELLTFAGAHLPYYTDLFARHGVQPQAADPLAELHKLPIQTKADVRAAGDRMVWRAVAGGAHPFSSGGTTGDTLYFHVDRVRQAQDLAARLFMQSLFGVQLGDRRLHLWGSPIEGRGSWVRRGRDHLLNEILLNAFDLSPARLDAYLACIRRLRPRVLYGYTSALTLLAHHAAAACGPRDFRWLKLVVLTGEEISPEQRAQVRRTFGAPVASEYGNREVGLIAHECPEGRLHVLQPHIHVDIVADGRTLPPGECGEVICTNLQTRAQPLIRYRVGDLGRLSDERCPCGLPLPVLRLEGGKISGFLALPDGRLCHGAVSSHAIKELPGIVSFRTHQKELDFIEILLVVDDAFQHESIARIEERYRRLLGPQVRIDCRIVDSIPPDPSGKRRHFISDVAPNYRQFVIRGGD